MAIKFEVLDGSYPFKDIVTEEEGLRGVRVKMWCGNNRRYVSWETAQNHAYGGAVYNKKRAADTKWTSEGGYIAEVRAVIPLDDVGSDLPAKVFSISARYRGFTTRESNPIDGKPTVWVMSSGYAQTDGNALNGLLKDIEVIEQYFNGEEIDSLAELNARIKAETLAHTEEECKNFSNTAKNREKKLSPILIEGKNDKKEVKVLQTV